MAQGYEIGRPVRLCFVGDGNNYHIKKWLPALVRAGLHVTLISFDQPDAPLEGVETRMLKRHLTRKASYVNYLQPTSDLKRILTESQCDVLMGSYATHYGWLAARTGFSPFVMQTWTGDLTVYPVDWPKRLVFSPIVRSGFSHADLITTDGRALRDLGARHFPEFANKMVPIRWGIAAAHADPLHLRERKSVERSLGIRIPEDSLVVTAPRGLQHWYQPQAMIEGLLRALERDPKLYVIFLTLAHERDDSLAQRLDKLAAQDRVHVADQFLTGDAMESIWRATDVVLSVPHADGVSESVLESVYWGGYPVLSDIPSNRSLVEDGLRASLLPPAAEDLPIAIEDAIASYGQEPAELLQKLRVENTQWVFRNATVDQTAKKLTNMIVELVERRPRPSN